MSQDRDWKTLAIGMGALLEQLEAHCSVRTGKTGPAHAKEGREIREAMGSFIALVREELAKAPVDLDEFHFDYTVWDPHGEYKITHRVRVPEATVKEIRGRKTAA